MFWCIVPFLLGCVLVNCGIMARLEEMWARFSLSEEEERGTDVDGQEESIIHRFWLVSSSPNVF